MIAAWAGALIPAVGATMWIFIPFYIMPEDGWTQWFFVAGASVTALGFVTSFASLSFAYLYRKDEFLFFVALFAWICSFMAFLPCLASIANPPPIFHKSKV